MDRAERETRDFMSVESFSQLPFIRPSPKGGEGAGGSGIRLFGKEFGGDHSDDNNGEESKESNAGDNSGDTSSRKFECHYCCRNFPTSQALGGHQNAHKRERQSAKRAHLQSVMVHGGISIDAAHNYGLMSYGGGGRAPPLPPPYHSWSAATRPSYISYNAHPHHHQQQPINGSPLRLWRIPATAGAAGNPSPFAHRQMNHHPLMSNKNEQPSQSRFSFESKPAMQDHLSLDLHL